MFTLKNTRGQNVLNVRILSVDAGLFDLHLFEAWQQWEHTFFDPRVMGVMPMHVGEHVAFEVTNTTAREIALQMYAGEVMFGRNDKIGTVHTSQPMLVLPANGKLYFDTDVNGKAITPFVPTENDTRKAAELYQQELRAEYDGLSSWEKRRGKGEDMLMQGMLRAIFEVPAKAVEIAVRPITFVVWDEQGKPEPDAPHAKGTCSVCDEFRAAQSESAPMAFVKNGTMGSLNARQDTPKVQIVMAMDMHTVMGSLSMTDAHTSGKTTWQDNGLAKTDHYLDLTDDGEPEFEGTARWAQFA